jgi:hypothetical protein
MLIDRTYFIGELNVPNTDQVSVGELLDWFIEKYETEFLSKVLGYELYKALKAGLIVPVVDQKWTDLIEGVEYTNLSGRLTFWKGLVTQPPSIINALDALNTIEIRPGGTGTYDPVAGQNTLTIPPALVGKDFIIEQRGVGQLRTDEYSIVGNILTLTTGVFAGTDTYFLKSATLAINTSTGVNKKSPIANYIYYWYVRNNHSQTATMGETKTKNENADNYTPAIKMVRSWNEMSKWICELIDYLNALPTTYEEWSMQNVFCVRNEFSRINEFNI